MKKLIWAAAAGLMMVLCGPLETGAEERMEVVRDRDVIYGYKHGMALTMDVLKPARPNGAGVVYVMSGGWFSAREFINPEILEAFTGRGYTVFAVVHGSQPKFTIPEAVADMHRAVRYIRTNAKKWDVDPERLGIAGGSAGGHLSLMIAASGGPGDAASEDVVERASSRVAAAAVFFPPTDFMNYGRAGRDVFEALHAELKAFQAPFDFVETDEETGRLVLLRDMEKRREIARQMSPITHVSPGDPPTLLIHGTNDELVPIQQSRVMEKALREAGTPVKVEVREGAGHGWEDWVKDMQLFADWFDRWLAEKS